MYKNTQKEQVGFSILEIIVATSIVSIGLVGVLSLISQNLKAEFVNKNVLIASQLSQEGIELVRNIRDNNWIQNDSWKAGIVFLGDNDYIIDYSSGVNGNINDSDHDGNIVEESGTRLFINNNFYSHDDGGGSAVITPFYRLIKISNEAPDSIEVSSVVQWQDKNKVSEYKIDTILYNWK